MGKIGIYGSSFDPITNVHLWTANTIRHRCKLDKVIFLPCSSKRKDKQMQTDDSHRMNMLQLAIENNDTFIADDYEMTQNAWNISTYETLTYFKTKYKNDTIYFIMGADLLIDIGKGKWGNSSNLVQENKFIVMARDGINMLKAISSSPILRNHDDGETFHLIDKGLAMEISSTYIREEFSLGGDPRYLLPEVCYKYINEHSLYR
ncbi:MULTISPECIES: nicotinate (nicotinamide) nucleotide adenylyltransferase [Metabacillus]|uniref:Probable nicotinate-nucleotide adenylyltransferase n=2 Tax=Metabacillus TaxID=2675233 RepID=A0A179SK30_9BACI|nr:MULTISPECIES: nicotinate (nicotinamide) nucleotide adenylyltransferase [Metabacillus]OAS82067.1 nicotinate-nicotinamide nucleotide adenylyltransferase [Metabacillus litoralis]QNF29734.1 nicotinate (nicotinamide) nucleotide adenylyltransferase [Metabacillus sp. KUDC1714]